MINSYSIFKELFTSKKIKRNTKVLHIFFQNNNFVSYNIDFLVKNEEHLFNLKSQFRTIIYENSDSLDILDDFDFDVILFSNLFSLMNEEKINQIIQFVKEKSKNSLFMFLNEIIYKDVQRYHPFSWIRNFIYNVSPVNIGKTVFLSDVYEILQENGLKILDSSRITSDHGLISYPIENFLIVCCKYNY